MPSYKGEEVELAVDAISQLPIDIWSRIELIAIFIGEKPATILFEKVDESGQINMMISCIEKIGLLVELGEKEYFEPGGAIIDGQYYPKDGYYRVPIFIARTKANLEAIIAAKTDEELGRVFGFPETAIMAFVGKGNYTKFFMPYSTMLSGPDYYLMVQFVLSVENWHEEVEQVKRVFESIKIVAPNLVERYIEAWRHSEIVEWVNVATGEKVEVLKLSADYPFSKL